jgi:hypothetical protein
MQLQQLEMQDLQKRDSIAEIGTVFSITTPTT